MVSALSRLNGLRGSFDLLSVSSVPLRVDLLARLGGDRFQVDWASSYEQAIAAIAERHHDLYLVDHALGTHSGLDLLRHLNAAAIRRPLILLTNPGERATEVEGMQAGASDCLVRGCLRLFPPGRPLVDAAARRRRAGPLHRTAAARSARGDRRSRKRSRSRGDLSRLDPAGGDGTERAAGTPVCTRGAHGDALGLRSNRRDRRWTTASRARVASSA